MTDDRCFWEMAREGKVFQFVICHLSFVIPNEPQASSALRLGGLRLQMG